MTFVLAHLSDLHLPMSGPPTIRQLLGKRLLSYLAWQRKRASHARDLPPALLKSDLEREAPDVIAVTGDLTNLALPAEFTAAAGFLRALGPPGRVLAIPGNHDALVRVPAAQGLDHWAPWMRGDDGAGGFPYERRRGGIALLGLSSAVVTPPGYAAGALGEAQLARLGPMLRRLREEGAFRIVLIHHPPTGERARRALRDRAALLEVLAREGAELLLHGHSHRPGLTALRGPGGSSVVAIGVPQALAGAGQRHGARWHRYAISRDGNGWRVETTVRGHRDGAFATLGHWGLRIEPPPAP